MTHPAEYHDGLTARAIPAAIYVDGKDLVVATADGDVRWPLTEVRFVDKARPGVARRLRCGFDRDDRLRLPSDDDGAWLRPHCPNLDRTTPGWRGHWRAIAIWGGTAAVAVVVLIAVVIPLLAERVAFLVPAEVEARIGAETRDQIIKVLAALDNARDASAMVCGDAAAGRAVAGLVDRLTRGPDAPESVAVTILDTPMNNAVALPGGQILLFRGMLTAAANGNAVAGVLAHEIGHLQRRHPMAISLRRGGSALLIGLLMGDFSGGALVGAGIEAAVGAAYTREMEAEADAIAVDLMNAAGLDGRPVADHFRAVARLLQDVDQDPLFDLFSTHPGLEDRARKFETETRGVGRAFSGSEWRSVKEACR